MQREKGKIKWPPLPVWWPAGAALQLPGWYRPVFTRNLPVPPRRWGRLRRKSKNGLGRPEYRSRAPAASLAPYQAI